MPTSTTSTEDNGSVPEEAEDAAAATSAEAASAPPPVKAAKATKSPTAAAPAAASGPGGGTASDADLAATLDGLNLEQALLDFATANARVLDLTRRLCTLNEELVELRNENVRQSIELERLRRLESQLRSVGVSQGLGVLRRLANLLRRALASLR